MIRRLKKYQHFHTIYILMTMNGLNELINACETKGREYEHLETLCLMYPGRISGSAILESA